MIKQLTISQFNNFCETNDIDFIKVLENGYNLTILSKNYNKFFNTIDSQLEKRIYTKKVKNFYIVEIVTTSPKTDDEQPETYFLISNKKDFSKIKY